MRVADDQSLSGIVVVDRAELARHWGWIMAAGIVTLLAGAAAIIVPWVAALAIEILVGCLLIVDGIVQCIHMYHLRRCKGLGWGWAAGILSLVVGILLLLFPIAGVFTIGLLIGLFFLGAGVIRAILAVQLRDLAGWRWLLASGVLSLVLGAVILGLLLHAAPWVIGILVGVHLLVGGVWAITLAVTLRQWQQV